MSMRGISGWLGCLLLFCSGVAAETPSPCERPLRIIRNAEYEPDDDDRFLQAVMVHAGCQLHVVISAHRVTLPRRFELLRAGDIDLVIGINRLPEREGYGHFSIPFRQEITHAWIRQQDRAAAEGKTVAQLVGEKWKVIAPAQGWFGPYVEGLRSQSDGIAADYKRVAQGVNLLLRQRGDLLIADEVWLSRLPEHDKALLHRLPDVLHEESLYFLYSAQTVSTATVAHLDRSIKAVRTSEAIAR